MDCTVLIVDDHPSFRASARVLLESEGFNVIGEAVDGASAVAETCRLKPRARAAGRAAPRHRRLRRRGPHHRPPGLPGRDPRLQPRLVGLRSARRRAPARAASSPRPSSRASASRSCSFEATRPRAGAAGARGSPARAAGRRRRRSPPITSTDPRPDGGASWLGIGDAWIGTGLYAWWRRPANRVGALMTWTGFAWLLNALRRRQRRRRSSRSRSSSSNLYLAAFVHLLLAYPEGRIRRRRHRRLVAATYALRADRPAADPDCPGSTPRCAALPGVGHPGHSTEHRARRGSATSSRASRRSRSSGALICVLAARWRAASAARSAATLGAAAVVGRSC